MLSNHDKQRHVTRYGRLDRARAATLLMLALPGSAYLYQGEELGLAEVLDLPDEVREDPVFHRSGGADPGRDGCRVPLPWSGSVPPFGFSTSPNTWLPMPASWAGMTATDQGDDPYSTLSLYRAALTIRRGAFHGGLTWLDSPPHVLAFARDDGARCVVNLGPQPYTVDASPRLVSGPLVDGALPTDTAAWF